MLNIWNASDIEILWTLTGITGLGFALYNLREAVADVKFVKANLLKNGRALFARAGRKAESARALKQAIFVTLGIMAMIVPEPPEGTDLPTSQDVIRFCLRWGLMVAAGLTTYQSYLSFKLRKDLKKEDYGNR